MNLDATCGRNFRYRDLIECGETWHRLADVDNRPKALATYDWMRSLCELILDPLTDAHGRIELTYGFASRDLTRHIPRGIAPSLDQHAAAEITSKGVLVCARAGFAVDLRTSDGDSFAVARWVAKHTAFDRLYVYGSDRPVHVSVGPENARTIVLMGTLPSGKRVPRVIHADQLYATD